MKNSELDRMKSVNVHLTDPVLRAIEGFTGENRSEAARSIISSILAAKDAGSSEPVHQVGLFAGRTSAKVRRALTLSGSEVFHKSIIWVPETMYHRLEAEARDLEIRVSDFIRGALFGLAGIDPARQISSEGHELWATDVRSGR